MKHVATVVLSVKMDSTLPTGKPARIVTTRITMPMYVGNTKGRGALASTVTMVHPIMVETTIEETSEATVAAIKATGMATSHAETFMKCKLMISYRTSSKNKGPTTAIMIILTKQSLIG